MTALDAARTAYLYAVRARLDADAAVVAAEVGCRRAFRDHDLSGRAEEAWNAARIRRMQAATAEQDARSAYERELYAATYGHGGRP